MPTPNTPKAIDEQIGSRVRSARIVLGLTQADLGKLVGVSYQQVMRYERGMDRVGAGRLQAIASALNQPVSFFFDGDPQAESIDREFPLESIDAGEWYKFAAAVAQIRDPCRRQSVIELVISIARSASS